MHKAILYVKSFLHLSSPTGGQGPYLRSYDIQGNWPYERQFAGWLDIVFTELNHAAAGWSFDILAADCYPYTATWTDRLQSATSLNALEYACYIQLMAGIWANRWSILWKRITCTIK